MWIWSSTANQPAVDAFTGAGINLGECALPARHPNRARLRCSGAVLGLAWQRFAMDTTGAVVNLPELVRARHDARSQPQAQTCETSK